MIAWPGDVSCERLMSRCIPDPTSAEGYLLSGWLKWPDNVGGTLYHVGQKVFGDFQGMEWGQVRRPESGEGTKIRPMTLIKASDSPVFSLERDKKNSLVRGKCHVSPQFEYISQ
jgi:hypothetical protein